MRKIKIEVGMRVNTLRRRSVTVLTAPDRRGEFRGRTWLGLPCWFHVVDVTLAWTPGE